MMSTVLLWMSSLGWTAISGSTPGPRVPAKLIWLLQEQWEDASGMSAEVSAGGGDVARAGAAEQADR